MKNNAKKLPSLLAKFIALTLLCACSKSTPQTTDMPPATPLFAKGADVSWVSEMEASGLSFYNNNGEQQNLFTILKNLGMNTVRLRVWVNPISKWNSLADVVEKALRAKDAGMEVLIDFHYSDTWADPGQQAIPAAWVNQDLATLKTSVYNHTTQVLNALKAVGVTPAWVQVGNEVNNGMLWPLGKASENMAAFAQLVNEGYAAVKAIFPKAKVIVHLSNGWDNEMYRWLFDGLKNNHVKWDVIGMSLYPAPDNWMAFNRRCLANMEDMAARYETEVMVVETGMSWDAPEAANAFLADIIQKTKSVPGNKGIGVLYWEPEAYNNWKGYTLGAFDNSGKPTKALFAFK